MELGPIVSKTSHTILREIGNTSKPKNKSKRMARERLDKGNAVAKHVTNLTATGKHTWLKEKICPFLPSNYDTHFPLLRPSQLEPHGSRKVRTKRSKNKKTKYFRIPPELVIDGYKELATNPLRVSIEDPEVYFSKNR